MTSPSTAPLRPRVLLVDDDAPFRMAMRKILTRKGYAVDEAADGVDACLRLDKGGYDAVLLDLKMPRMDGLGVLKRYVDHGPSFIMLTGHGTIQTAVEAMRIGATSFLQKPFENDHLLALIADSVRHPEAPAPQDTFIGESAPMQRVKAVLERVAPTDETVCLMGETGTGKELAARRIHDLSGRAAGPFVALNCACVGRELFESELFGHVRGAFTGATGDRAGLYRQANGGTLFIDEVGELPLDCQAKLLRVLEMRRIRPVGGSTELEVDVRVVAATNRDLAQEVREGRFREDLFFRLQVVPVILPPLRDRPGDIPLLVSGLTPRLATDRPGGSPTLTPEALSTLERYSWPGNVRELINVLKRAMLFSPSDTIDAPLIEEVIEGSIFSFGSPFSAPPPSAVAPPPEAEPRSLEEVERAHIARLYEQLGGNVTHLAKALGIDRRTLQRKLRAYGYPPKQ